MWGQVVISSCGAQTEQTGKGLLNYLRLDAVKSIVLSSFLELRAFSDFAAWLPKGTALF